MHYVIQTAQIILSIVLITLILIQSKGVGLSGAFGGSGDVYYTRRGAEKVIFIFSIIVASLFVVASVLNVWLS